MKNITHINGDHFDALDLMERGSEVDPKLKSYQYWLERYLKEQCHALDSMTHKDKEVTHHLMVASHTLKNLYHMVVDSGYDNRYFEKEAMMLDQSCGNEGGLRWLLYVKPGDVDLIRFFKEDFQCECCDEYTEDSYD
ncbi:hypothetical protein N9442_03790 [Gammaproteobacteria bacterium]|nr:hypothetical protein [Gammaproteobacteria bacterium]